VAWMGEGQVCRHEGRYVGTGTGGTGCARQHMGGGRRCGSQRGARGAGGVWEVGRGVKRAQRQPGRLLPHPHPRGYAAGQASNAHRHTRPKEQVLPHGSSHPMLLLAELATRAEREAAAGGAATDAGRRRRGVDGRGRVEAVRRRRRRHRPAPQCLILATVPCWGGRRGTRPQCHRREISARRRGGWAASAVLV
jgi:hypothetical protein